MHVYEYLLVVVLCRDRLIGGGEIGASPAFRLLAECGGAML